MRRRKAAPGRFVLVAARRHDFGEGLVVDDACHTVVRAGASDLSDRSDLSDPSDFEELARFHAATSFPHSAKIASR
jgi:hypothetical protein